jgi:hypothetical protein
MLWAIEKAVALGGQQDCSGVRPSTVAKHLRPVVRLDFVASAWPGRRGSVAAVFVFCGVATWRTGDVLGGVLPGLGTSVSRRFAVSGAEWMWSAEIRAGLALQGVAERAASAGHAVAPSPLRAD